MMRFANAQDARFEAARKNLSYGHGIFPPHGWYVGTSEELDKIGVTAMSAQDGEMVQNLEKFIRVCADPSVEAEYRALLAQHAALVDALRKITGWFDRPCGSCAAMENGEAKSPCPVHGTRVVRARAVLAKLEGGPQCGHSACRQYWIDTGKRECVKED